MTTLDAPVTAPARDLRPAAYALFGLLVASQLAITAFLAWEPPFDGAVRYDDITPIADAWWPMNVLLGGPGFALGAVTTSIFLAVLGTGRGNALALAGAGLHLVAGIVFALVITAEVLPFAWAAGLEEAEGRALFETWNDRLDGFLPYILGSMALVALGALISITGVALSGGLPWWVLVVGVVIVVGLFALPLGNPLTAVLDLAQRVLWVYIGWRGLISITSRA